VATGSDRQARKRGTRRIFALTASIVGSIVGITTNLYSAEFRQGISGSVGFVGSRASGAVIAAVVASAVSLGVYQLLVVRRRNADVKLREIAIEADALGGGADPEDQVVGRSLKLLEVKRDSQELAVFLHGLGLDANDFRGYLSESRFHCIALTLFGFNAEESTDDHYQPISLDSHIRLLWYALRQIRRRNPTKDISLVGFSFGADMILFLAEKYGEELRELGVTRAVLLDPNLGPGTLTISSLASKLHTDRPLEELKNILSKATSLSEFRNLSEYVYKITSKNLRQIRRHAEDVVNLWTDTSYATFLDRLGQVIRHTDEVFLVLSFSYERHFNAVAAGVTSRGLAPARMECSRADHFGLIESAHLKERLEGVMASETKPESANPSGVDRRY